MLPAFAAVTAGALGALVVLQHRDREMRDTTSVASRENGKKYRVLPRQDARDAADVLARLERRARDFLDRAKGIFPARGVATHR